MEDGAQLHTGKCICRFSGIYAYCRYFIDWKWWILVLILYRKTCHMPKGLNRIRSFLNIRHAHGDLCKHLRIHWRRYRGQQPAGPAGGGAALVVLARCSMSCNGQLWRPGGISPLCYSITRFIVGLCLLIKTST